ncbi:MAG: hypothetical protein IJB07_01085, partial [Firmicutes bacterium]|nr:hypothetical protein [Bacillota bacterium]
ATAAFAEAPRCCYAVDVSFAAASGIPEAKCGKLAQGPMVGVAPILNREMTQAMLAIAKEKLTACGYEPYYMYRQKHMSGNFENIGWSKPGTESIYNIRIMEEDQTIVAMGAGGISKMYYPEENRLERVPNVSNYEIYIERIDEMIERKRIGIE